MHEPTFGGHLLISTIIALDRFNVRLLLDSVEVLVDAVDDEGEKLLRIVLSVT